MKTARKPWTFVAGIVLAVAGAGLAGAGAWVGIGVLISSLCLLAAAMLELAAGQSLTRTGGAGLSHFITGGIATALAVVLYVVSRVYPWTFAAGFVTLFLGLFAFSTGLASALDLIVDRPRAALAQGFKTLVSLGVALVAFRGWHAATPALLATLAGLEVLAVGVAIAASGFSQSRHPGEAPYDGLPERLAARL